MRLILSSEVPPDMYVALHTLVYSADKAGIDELQTIAMQIVRFYGKDFVKQGEDPKATNDIIRENISLTVLDEGLKVSRLLQIARDEGLHYVPTERSLAVLCRRQTFL